MEQEKKMALQAAKEIVVKFIETGRISPNNFSDFFSGIYSEILTTITAAPAAVPGVEKSSGIDADRKSSK